MTAFEDLKSEWENQSPSEIPEDGATQIQKRIVAIRKQQQIANIVLAITGVILIIFFFYVSAYKFQPVMIGLLLMIGALAFRIGIEFLSIKTLKKMDVSTTVSNFKERMKRYYVSRKKVHFIGTPIIILVYCIGFVMLLPAFRESLSEGFYNYIIVSGIVVLLILSFFIGREVKKELIVLKELKDEEF